MGRRRTASLRQETAGDTRSTNTGSAIVPVTPEAVLSSSSICNVEDKVLASEKAKAKRLLLPAPAAVRALWSSANGAVLLTSLA